MQPNILSAQDLLRYRKLTDKTLPDSLGQKEYAPSGTWLEETQLDCLLRERRDLLDEPRVARFGDLAQGLWDFEAGQVKIVKEKGKSMQNMGRVVDKVKLLHPEEALFLMETATLEVTFKGVPLSLLEAYSLFLLDADDLGKYKVYSHLSRLGYIVVRHQGRLNVTPYEKKMRLDQYVHNKKDKRKKEIKATVPTTCISNSEVSNFVNSTKATISINDIQVSEQVDRKNTEINTLQSSEISLQTSVSVNLESKLMDQKSKCSELTSQVSCESSSDLLSESNNEFSLRIQESFESKISSSELPSEIICVPSKESQSPEFRSLQKFTETCEAKDITMIEDSESRSHEVITLDSEESHSLTESKDISESKDVLMKDEPEVIFLDTKVSQLNSKTKEVIGVQDVVMLDDPSQEMSHQLDEFYRSLHKAEEKDLASATTWDLKPEIPSACASNVKEKEHPAPLHEDVVFPNFAGRDFVLLTKLPNDLLPKNLEPSKEMYKLSKHVFLCSENSRPFDKQNKRNFFNHYRGAKFGKPRMQANDSQQNTYSTLIPDSEKSTRNMRVSDQDQILKENEPNVNAEQVTTDSTLEGAKISKDFEPHVVVNSYSSVFVESQTGDLLGFIDRKKPDSETPNRTLSVDSGNQKRYSPTTRNNGSPPHKFCKEQRSVVNSRWDSHKPTGDDSQNLSSYDYTMPQRTGSVSSFSSPSSQDQRNDQETQDSNPRFNISYSKPRQENCDSQEYFNKSSSCRSDNANYAITSSSLSSKIVNFQNETLPQSNLDFRSRGPKFSNEQKEYEPSFSNYFKSKGIQSANSLNFPSQDAKNLNYSPSQYYRYDPHGRNLEHHVWSAQNVPDKKSWNHREGRSQHTFSKSDEYNNQYRGKFPESTAYDRNSFINAQERSPRNPSYSSRKYFQQGTPTTSRTDPLQYEAKGRPNEIPFSNRISRFEHPMHYTESDRSSRNRMESSIQMSKSNNYCDQSRRQLSDSGAYDPEPFSHVKEKASMCMESAKPSFSSLRSFEKCGNIGNNQCGIWSPSASRLDTPYYVTESTFNTSFSSNQNEDRFQSKPSKDDSQNSKPNWLNPNATPFEPKFLVQTRDTGIQNRLGNQDVRNFHETNFVNRDNHSHQRVTDLYNRTTNKNFADNSVQPRNDLRTRTFSSEHSKPVGSRWDNGSNNRVAPKRPKRDDWRGGPDYPSAIPKLKVPVKCWSHFKSVLLSLQEMQGQGMGKERTLYTGKTHPLVKCHHKTDIADVMSKLKLIPQVHLTLNRDVNNVPDFIEDKMEIHFDIYLPDVIYKSSNPTLPNLRIVVISNKDPVPSLQQIAHLQRPLHDGVPLYFALVSDDGVAFHGMHDVSLPQLNTS